MTKPINRRKRAPDPKDPQSQEPDSDDQQILNRITAILSFRDAEVAAWCRLPGWVPLPIRNQFEIDFGNLLGELRREWPDFDPALLNRAIENAADWYANPKRETERIADFDVIHAAEIHNLGKVRYAARLNSTEGLRQLAGDVAEKGARFSVGGTTKKGKQYEPANSIQTICYAIQSTKFDDLLEFLRDADACADLYESVSTPIQCSFLGVDDEHELVRYYRRAEGPDRERTLSFQRLRDILTRVGKVTRQTP